MLIVLYSSTMALLTILMSEEMGLSNEILLLVQHVT